MDRPWRRVEDGALPGPLFLCGEVGSSLDVAREILRQGDLPEWGSVLALSQTGGRGQLRRHWVSPPGNIYAALRLPAVPPLDGTAAAPAVGLLVAEALAMLGVEVRLKWPNDLVACFQGRYCKLCGILLEEYGGALVAGIGVNVLSSPASQELRRDHALSSTHLAAIAPEFTKTTPDSGVEALWKLLVRNIFFCYAQELPFSARWRRAAEALLLWRGENVAFIDDATACQGVLYGLGPSGGICLAHDGRTEEFLSGSLNSAAGTGSRP